nr:hypothetical protein 3 [Ginkgo biloba tombusvirus]
MTKPSKRKTKNKKKVARRSRPRVRMQDPRAVAFARALTDPCNAPLEPGVYPGQVGFITRLAQTFNISLSSTQTAFMLAVVPGAGLSYQTSQADIATAITVSYLNTFVPGASFMTANCRSVRALGACFEFFTNATPLNAQGTFHYGVAPGSVIMNGAPNIGTVLPNLQHMQKVNADAYELKWRPGVLDEQYKTPNTNLTAVEWDDVNQLVLCGTGFPVSSSITVKVTLIMEWLPATNLGLATPAATNPSGTRSTQVVAALDAHHPSWWSGPIGAASKFVWKHGGAELASFMTQTGAQAVARQVAARAAPLLLL